MNICIIPEVARLLQEKDRDKSYRFIVTLPERGKEVRKFWTKAEKYAVTSMIENAGVLKLHECPRWYATSDIVFLPTVLETFSATYPEAMVLGKPIVTTDLEFAHDICGDAAAFYSPLSAEAASDAIIQVVTNRKFRESLVENGRKRLEQFPNPERKYQLMLQWIQELADLQK
jgi:glycosyltransferase involved in cell wall biosynthesis